MFGRRKRGVDAKRLVPIMVEAFAAEGMEATHDSRAILIAMPGGLQAPLELETLLAGANQYEEEDLREFARGVVLGFMRGCRRQGILVGTHYPLPDDDVARRALLDAFRAAGTTAVFVDPQRISIRLDDGSDAVTDVRRYLAGAEGAAPDAVAATAAEFVRRSAEILADPGAPGLPRDDLRLRLYPEEMLVEPLRSGVVTRELAPGLWETVAIDRPDSVQPLPRGGPDDLDVAATDELFRAAIDGSVEDEFTLRRLDVDGVRFLAVDGLHPYAAAHVHVLGRYLDAPFPDGALVGFPVPETMAVCPLGTVHPGRAVAMLQGLVETIIERGGEKPISAQVFWWVPSETERSRPEGAVELGHRPDLRPLSIETEDGRSTLRCPAEFGELIQRFQDG